MHHELCPTTTPFKQQIEQFRREIIRFGHIIFYQFSVAIRLCDSIGRCAIPILVFIVIANNKFDISKTPTINHCSLCAYSVRDRPLHFVRFDRMLLYFNFILHFIREKHYLRFSLFSSFSSKRQIRINRQICFTFTIATYMFRKCKLQVVDVVEHNIIFFHLFASLNHIAFRQFCKWHGPQKARDDSTI